jgi:hypothetical protein
MSQEAINRAVRRSRKARTLGPEARCWKCGLADPIALERKWGKIWCYECARAHEGRPTVERHHVIGEANDASRIGVPGDVHRALSDAQEDWPEATRYNHDADPLRWIAALLRTLRDMAQWAVEKLETVALWTESCADMLRERLGSRWWETTGIGPLWNMGGEG